MLEPLSHLEVKRTPEAHFSWLRTRLSLERTLMSWVRTATALIGFGFSIVQFFEPPTRISTEAMASNPRAIRTCRGIWGSCSWSSAPSRWRWPSCNTVGSFVT